MGIVFLFGVIKCSEIESIVVVAQHGEYAKNHWVVHFKRVNFMVWELYNNKKISMCNIISFIFIYIFYPIHSFIHTSCIHPSVLYTGLSVYLDKRINACNVNIKTVISRCWDLRWFTFLFVLFCSLGFYNEHQSSHINKQILKWMGKRFKQAIIEDTRMVNKHILIISTHQRNVNSSHNETLEWL